MYALECSCHDNEFTEWIVVFTRDEHIRRIVVEYELVARAITPSLPLGVKDKFFSLVSTTTVVHSSEIYRISGGGCVSTTAIQYYSLYPPLASERKRNQHL